MLFGELYEKQWDTLCWKVQKKNWLLLQPQRFKGSEVT